MFSSVARRAVFAGAKSTIGATRIVSVTPVRCLATTFTEREMGEEAKYIRRKEQEETMKKKLAAILEQEDSSEEKQQLGKLLGIKLIIE